MEDFSQTHEENQTKMNSSAESASFHEIKTVFSDYSDKSFKCDYCKKTFSSSANLVKHNKMHNLSTTLRMKSFQKALCSSKGFSKNLKMHSLFECSFCKKLFAHKSNLTQHLRIHSGEKPFECNLCGKSFTSSSNLVQHVSTHAVQNPFKCGYCKKVFTKSNELTKHIQSHTETRPNRISLVSSPPSDGLSNFSAPINLVWTAPDHGNQQQQLSNESQEPSSEISSHSTSANSATTPNETEGKPDHTYCSGSSHLQQNSSRKEKTLLPSKNVEPIVKSKNYLIEGTDKPLAPDHTYWSTCDPTQNNSKKKTKTTKEPKSLHSSLYKKTKLSTQSCTKVKSDSGSDHTYCTGGSHHKKCQMLPETSNPDLDSNGYGIRNEDYLKLNNCGPHEKTSADHTYSSGSGNKSNVSQKIKSEAAQISLTKPKQIILANRTDNSGLDPDNMDPNPDCLDADAVIMEASQDRLLPDQDRVNPDCDRLNPDHIYCIDLDVQIISVGQEVDPDVDRGVELVSTVQHGQPDHTYCHGKNKMSSREGNKDGSKRSAKKENSVCLNDCCTEETLSVTVPPNRDILDHTYCFGDKLVHNTIADWDNDHTYCSDNGHLQNITCSDDWSSGMKFDHTYCLVQTVSRHF